MFKKSRQNINYWIKNTKKRRQITRQNTGGQEATKRLQKYTQKR